MSAAPLKQRTNTRPAYPGQDIAIMRSWAPIYRLLARVTEIYDAENVTVSHPRHGRLFYDAHCQPRRVLARRQDHSERLQYEGALGFSATSKDKFAGKRITQWYMLNACGFKGRERRAGDDGKEGRKRRMAGRPARGREAAEKLPRSCRSWPPSTSTAR